MAFFKMVLRRVSNFGNPSLIKSGLGEPSEAISIIIEFIQNLKTRKLKTANARLPTSNIERIPNIKIISFLKRKLYICFKIETIIDISGKKIRFF